MFYFEYKQELYYILCLLVVPAICCTVLYFVKPKWIGLSPVITICLSCIITYIFYPYFFGDIANGEYDFTTVFWLYFFVPAQVVSALGFAGITHVVFKKSKRYNKKSAG